MRNSNTTYRLTLSDGKKVTCDATSAAQAIEDILWEHRERTVIACYAGVTAEDAEILRTFDRDERPMVGIVDLTDQIPKHEAIKGGVVRPKVARRTDTTIPMFNDADIKGESERARYHAAEPL